jgi:hypothetical protein
MLLRQACPVFETNWMIPILVRFFCTQLELFIDVCRCGGCNCQRAVRARQPKTRGLPIFGSATVPFVNNIVEQLDAHQDRQTRTYCVFIKLYVLTMLQFGSLCPHEPRLVKKLLPVITELITTTSAISLLYECVHTCITGGMLQGYAGNNLATTCVTKLAAFLQDTDHNREHVALKISDCF